MKIGFKITWTLSLSTKESMLNNAPHEMATKVVMVAMFQAQDQAQDQMEMVIKTDAETHRQMANALFMEECQVFADNSTHVVSSLLKSAAPVVVAFKRITNQVMMEIDQMTTLTAISMLIATVNVTLMTWNAGNNVTNASTISSETILKKRKSQKTLTVRRNAAADPMKSSALQPATSALINTSGTSLCSEMLYKSMANYI